jgi:hypothetical protein
MTIEKTYTAPALPYAPTTEFNATFMDGYSRILRLYFNLNDNLIDQILQLLNNGGYFPVLTAGEFNGGNFNGDTANLDLVNAGQILAAIAYLQTVYAGGVQAQNVLANNLTGSSVNASIFTGSGRQINFPHIAASDSTDQVAGGNDTPTVVNFNTLDSGLGWTLNSPGSATADYAGIYKITFSLQFVNTANAIHSAVVWLKNNNVDIPNSATEFSVPARKSASVPSYVAAYSEITFEVAAGDEIELYWATDLAGNPTTPTDGIYIFHDTAKTVAGGAPYDRPAIPSVIGSIVYLSAPPDPKTQVALVGVAGVGAVGSVSILVY